MVLKFYFPEISRNSNQFKLKTLSFLNKFQKKIHFTSLLIFMNDKFIAKSNQRSSFNVQFKTTLSFLTIILCFQVRKKYFHTYMLIYVFVYIFMYLFVSMKLHRIKSFQCRYNKKINSESLQDLRVHPQAFNEVINFNLILCCSAM